MDQGVVCVGNTVLLIDISTCGPAACILLLGTKYPANCRAHTVAKTVSAATTRKVW